MEAEAPAAAMDTGQGRDNHVLVERSLPLPLNSCSSDQVDSTSGDQKASRPSHESRMSPEQVQCSTKVTQCGSCRTEFDTSKAYLEHVCCGEARPCKRGDGQQDGSDNSSISDVENFTGKIVYNPDGSAYIIEGADSELSDDECSLDLPQQEGCIVDARGVTPSPFRVFPQVVNALHISRNPALYSALYGQAYSLLQEKKKVPEVPVMHSYRVFTMRDRQATESGTSNDDTNLGSTKHSSKIDKSNFPILDYATVPIKPILMCFICKLSFGYAKSFVAHAVGEHNITLVEEEREVMSQKNTSAVIQGVGKDKEPLLSFLEPIPTSSAQVIGYPKFSSAYYVPNSSCPSSFASKDPVTTVFLNAVNTAVSSAMRGGYSAAVTTLVSATSSPVSSSMPEISASKSSSLTRHTLGGPDSEVLAPELEDLANIEKMAKAAAAAAAEASGTRPPSSPMSEKQHEKESSPNGHIEETDSSDVRSNLFAFGSGNLSRLERPTSTGSTDSTSPGVRMSPKGLITPSPVVPTCHSPAPSTSSPVCVQHPEGKPNGVECSKCDMVMGVNRSLGTQMTMMHSRNSCKTLKCPKCNWHYKYQETLEIHMKEKHPENEMSCIYCLTNQPHPRLARGETYTCGYKPYRCEVCNYSTTTKGNLSIHMQSDKHINNVQELQNGNISTDHMLQPQGLPAPPLPDPMKKAPPTNKPKATWRCDVCNYETNVARNLRIHMTSEKHTHNMMVLQQNVKHMQQFTAFQQAQALDPLFQFHPGLLLPCDAQLQPEAALADMAYNHALLMMATQQQQQQQQQRAMAAAAAVAAVSGTGKSTLGPPINVGSTVDMEQGDTALRTDVPYDDSHKLFQCCVCNVYSADNIENLNQHMQQDRTWQREEEVLMAVAGSYICKLCTYKTNLKANFQLHCKTDKHLQKLQHFNHVKEGGPVTEWKLKYMNVNNPVQVRCNACDYYTNSIHKLQLHTANPRHETSSKLFLHLQIKENSLNIENKYYSCKLCHFFTRTKLNLIQHVHSLRHLRNDNIRQMQLKTEGRDVTEDIFLVKEYKGNEKIIFDADVGEFSPFFPFVSLSRVACSK
ncbi:zinc finger homeobox protein 4-like [Centruroides sculpturatus]|uniref:zinc finger homeobox protein 4-like n=1 Tax=Centruroides sculpturatus TaxID=218467 RepID=UPI000C6D87DD|nr:zinc finger homeobox protein 4-like [Centruroides sculpturatus]